MKALRKNKRIKTNLFLLALLLAVFPALAIAGPHEHGEDVVVGRTAAGQLATEVPVPGPHELPPVSGLLNGWALDDPGILTLEMDEPDVGFFMLESGAIINLELVAIDPALKIWSPGFLDVLTAPGQSFVLGGSEFHAHPTFHIDSTDPAFDPDVDVYAVTFRLFDSGATSYADSEPFTLSFTPVPEPCTALLTGLGALGLVARFGRRQRRDS